MLGTINKPEGKSLNIASLNRLFLLFSPWRVYLFIVLGLDLRVNDSYRHPMENTWIFCNGCVSRNLPNWRTIEFLYKGIGIFFSLAATFWCIYKLLFSSLSCCIEWNVLTYFVVYFYTWYYFSSRQVHLRRLQLNTWHLAYEYIFSRQNSLEMWLFLTVSKLFKMVSKH